MEHEAAGHDQRHVENEHQKVGQEVGGLRIVGGLRARRGQRTRLVARRRVEQEARSHLAAGDAGVDDVGNEVLALEGPQRLVAGLHHGHPAGDEIVLGDEVVAVDLGRGQRRLRRGLAVVVTHQPRRQAGRGSAEQASRVDIADRPGVGARVGDQAAIVSGAGEELRQERQQQHHGREQDGREPERLTPQSGADLVAGGYPDAAHRAVTPAP